MASKKVDFIVIGGGSGGMAAAKKASENGASVIMFDYVTPSPQNTKWGLGGTCVNVGCIPKKLMHHAAKMRTEYISDSKAFGLNCPGTEVDYEQLYTTVNNYIRKLNFMYRGGVRKAGVEYINAKAYLTSDPKIIKYELKGVEHLVEAENVLIAVGGRPTLPNIEGIEHVITSDDFFWRKTNPGRTLVVGASYIGLECGGIIHGLGNDVDICVRSVVLRGFDRECSEKIRKHMEEVGVSFRASLPVSICKSEQKSENLEVKFQDGAVGNYDTILYAIGRSYDMKSIGIPDTITENGKIIVDRDSFETSILGVYAIGDIVKDNMELTPVAVTQGELLADRLFAKSTKKFDYKNICTTVFTPLEYGFVGYSEEQAISAYGSDNIETYLSEFESLDFSSGAGHVKVPHTRSDEFDTLQSPNNLSKVITLKGEEVLGIHYVGDNAGEVIQGFGVAMKTGTLTKAVLDSTIGIHPTNAESFCDLTVTRRSGDNYTSSGGCGGGKCG